MSIQANINQTLSVASFLASQSPLAASHREDVLRKRELNRIGKEIDAIQTEVESAKDIKVPDNTPEEAKASEQALKKNIALQERAYELEPSGERWGTLSTAYEKEGAFQEARAEEGRKESARIEKARKAEEDRAAAAELERTRITKSGIYIGPEKYGGKR